jgi:hypothetical protein
MDYFQIPAISNSSLSTFNYDPSYYHKVYVTNEIKDKKESDSLVFGSLVHCLILEPQEVQNRYVLSTLKPEEIPSGMMLDYYTALLKQEIQDELSQFRAYQISGYKIAIEKVLENAKKYTKYYDEKIAARDKTVITQSVYDAARAAADVAMDNPQWKAILGADKKWTEYKELEVLWTEEVNGMELNFKAKLDHLFIYEAEGTVIAKYFDYKTDSKNPVHKYVDTFLFWKSYRQMAFYQRAIVAFITQEFPDVELLVKPAMHLVPIDANRMKSLIYHVDRSYLEKGHLELNKNLNDLIWHIKHDKWEYPKDTYVLLEANKVLTLVEDEFYEPLATQSSRI